MAEPTSILDMIKPLLGPLAAWAGLGSDIQLDGNKIGSIISGALAGTGNMSDVEAVGRQIETALDKTYRGRINKPLFDALGNQKKALAYKIGKEWLGLNDAAARASASSVGSLSNILATGWFISPGGDYYNTTLKLSNLVPRQIDPKRPRAAQNAADFAYNAFNYILGRGDRNKYGLSNTELTDLLTHAYKRGGMSYFENNKDRNSSEAMNQYFNNISRLGEVAKQMSPQRNLAEGLAFLDQSLGSDFLLSPERVNKTSASLYRLSRLATMSGEDPTTIIRDIGTAMQGKPGVSAARMLTTAETFLRIKATASMKQGTPLDQASSARMLDLIHEAQDSDITSVAGAAYSRFARQYGKDRAGTMMSALLSDPKAMESASSLISAVNRRVGYGEVPFDMREVQLASGDDTAVGAMFSNPVITGALIRKAGNLHKNIIKGVETAIGGPLRAEDRAALQKSLRDNSDINTAIDGLMMRKYGDWKRGHNREARAYYNKLTQAVGNLGADARVANILTNPGFRQSAKDTDRDLIDPKYMYGLEGMPVSGWEGGRQLLTSGEKTTPGGLAKRMLFGDTLDTTLNINEGNGQVTRKPI